MRATASRLQLSCSAHAGTSTKGFLFPSQDTDELFYAEATRTVKKDNTFSFQRDRYETPIDLRGKQFTVRYERHRKGAVIVYDNGRRLGQARLLIAGQREGGQAEKFV